jgi:hypothetical protein
LAAGQYIISTTDANGCKDSLQVSVKEPNLLRITETVIHPLCKGYNGSGSLLVSGGTSPFSYEWTDNSSSVIGATASLSSLAAGSYYYIVKDANQCNLSDSMSIIEPQQLELSVSSKTHPVCSGNATGFVDLKINGGTSPYQFQLNSNAFQSSVQFASLLDGNYVFTAKDKNNCIDTVQVYLENRDTISPKVLLKKPTIYLPKTSCFLVSAVLNPPK